MELQLMDYLVFEEHYACFRPVGESTLAHAVDMIDEAIALCGDRGIHGILVNVTALTGFPSPTITERFGYVSRWSATSAGRVAIAMVAPAYMIDPDHIGVVMGDNRGLRSDVFTTESEALPWLLRQIGK